MVDPQTTDLRCPIELYRAVEADLTKAGGPFETVDVIVNGDRRRVFARASASLGEMIEAAAVEFADDPFLLDEEGTLSYGEFLAAVRATAGKLSQVLGSAGGQRVAIAMRNRRSLIILFSALLWRGDVAVMLNSRGSGSEMAAAAERTSCVLIIADVERAKRVAGVGTIPILLAGDDGELAGAGDAADMPSPIKHDMADRPAIILFTSGTTGFPKGAVLTHRNLCNMACSLKFVSTVNLELSARLYDLDAEALRRDMPAPSTLLVFPLFHVSGLSTLFLIMQAGGRLAMMRRWNPTEALAKVAAHRLSMISGPPLTIGDLLAQPDATERLGSLMSVAIGGQATPRSLVEKISHHLPHVAQSSGWGMTEVCGGASAAAGALFAARPSACGVALPLTDLRVIDADGRELRHREVGELCVRSGLLMKEYWDDPEATAGVIDADGWYRTGDVGYVDDEGFVHLLDRMKDMVISAGENIYCAELERVLSMDAGLFEACVFGVPDERLGERAVAAVTVSPGSSRSEAEVMQFMRNHLADYKVPSEIAFGLGPFPRNALGKVDKDLLRKSFLAIERQRA